MKKTLVRYKLKRDKVAENEALVKAVYQQLHEEKLEGFHYCTLKSADEVSFIHIALADTDEANAAFAQLSAFKKFQSLIKDRCEEPPMVQSMTVIGSYHFEL